MGNDVRGYAGQANEGALRAFEGEFEALVRRLQDRVVHLAATAGDDVQAGAIYGFPRNSNRWANRWAPGWDTYSRGLFPCPRVVVAWRVFHQRRAGR